LNTLNKIPNNSIKKKKTVDLSEFSHFLMRVRFLLLSLNGLFLSLKLLQQLVGSSKLLLHSTDQFSIPEDKEKGKKLRKRLVLK